MVTIHFLPVRGVQTMISTLSHLFSGALGADSESDGCHASRGVGGDVFSSGTRSRDGTPTKISSKKKKTYKVRLRRVGKSAYSGRHDGNDDDSDDDDGDYEI